MHYHKLQHNARKLITLIQKEVVYIGVHTYCHRLQHNAKKLITLIREEVVYVGIHAHCHKLGDRPAA